MSLKATLTRPAIMIEGTIGQGASARELHLPLSIDEAQELVKALTRALSQIEMRA